MSMQSCKQTDSQTSWYLYDEFSRKERRGEERWQKEGRQANRQEDILMVSQRSSVSKNKSDAIQHYAQISRGFGHRHDYLPGVFSLSRRAHRLTGSSPPRAWSGTQPARIDGLKANPAWTPRYLRGTERDRMTLVIKKVLRLRVHLCDWLTWSQSIHSNSNSWTSCAFKIISTS